MRKLMIIMVVFGGLIYTSCASGPESEDSYVVEIMAYDFAFDAPSELPSGWIRFVLNNEMGHEIHELTVARLHDGVTHEQYLDEYIGAWEILLAEYQNGEIERADIPDRASELLPEWADGVEYIIARGLISEGRVAEKTINLEPGNYVLDCWVKSSDGLIHISKGMTQKLTVTDEAAGSSEPETNGTITLHESEIDLEWEPETGSHSFALYLTAREDGRPHHNNIHLVRVDQDTDLGKVNRWMDWYEPGGMGLAAPAPADFLGGVSAYDGKPGDQAIYFALTIDEPGTYAWVVQVSPDDEFSKIIEVFE